MKCFEIQNEIPEYLEDMLAESVRAKIHAHLAGCEACRNHAARLGSLAGDLKEIGHVETLPFDLGKAVLEELSREPESRSHSFSGRKAAVLFAAALLLAGLFKAGQETDRYFKNMRGDEQKKIEDAEAAAILEKLKQTEASLQRSTGEAGAKAASRRTVSSLEPFHWQLRFASPSERELFSAQLKKVNPKETFRAEYFTAFSMDQAYLKDLLDIIGQSPAVVLENPRIDLKTLPQSEAPLQITLLMGTAGNRSPLSWRYLRFLRHDSYSFIRRLHELGFTFLTEARHFLILRVSSAEYETLKLEMGNTLGLEFVKGNNADSYLKNFPESFPVILFFQEG